MMVGHSHESGIGVCRMCDLDSGKTHNTRHVQWMGKMHKDCVKEDAVSVDDSSNSDGEMDKRKENGEKKTMALGPGDMYLHPAKIPHSPVRHEGSIGLVIERKRADLELNDGLLWFCDNCNTKLHEVYFVLNDIEKDFLTHFNHFYGSKRLRTCKNCGTVMPTDKRFTSED